MRIVDLSLTIREGMTTFPVHWHPFVEITQLGRFGIEDRETRKLVLGTHTGTHVDAPRHFIPNGAPIDTIPLDQFVGPARVCDFSRAEDFQEIGAEDLERELGGEHPERIIMRYDWCRRLDTMSYYTHHPYLSEQAAAWLVERGCRLLAMDTPMPDNPKHGQGCDIDSPIHKILLGNNVVLVEYLCNLKALNSKHVELTVAPLKILDGDGAPARVFAIERDERSAS